MFLILNVAMGGDFPAAFGAALPTGATASGVPMIVDYVAVYQTGGQPPTNPPPTSPPPTNPPPTNPPPTNPPPASDNTPPDTTIVSGPSGTTTDATPSFAFTSSESDPAFECQVDSGPWIDCTSPWSPAALGGGDHVVAVRSTDVAGNTDPSPATRSFTVAGPPPALSLLLGTATVQPVADSVSAGSAEAFAATASASGSVSQVSVYVDVGNTAPSMVVGLYSDDDGHPGTLLTQGTRTGLTALGWNDVTVARAALQSGERYWIALLGLGSGNLRAATASASAATARSADRRR
jgi:hypothetical protein